jgi:FkbM family methyltransferase
MVRRLFTAFGVPGKVVHAAASNELGTVYAPSVPTSSNRNDFYSPGKPGEERVQALPNAGPQRFTRFTRYNYTQRVPQLTVDALLREEAVHDVDLLTIDTEGHDALVLEGATETLAAQRVQVIEFEYSSGGLWKKGEPNHRTLKATLARLHRARYECFWAGTNGHVAPASGRFWCDAFEFHEWSNLVCMHAPRLLRVMYELAHRAGTVVLGDKVGLSFAI